MVSNIALLSTVSIKLHLTCYSASLSIFDGSKSLYDFRGSYISESDIPTGRTGNDFEPIVEIDLKNDNNKKY